MLVHTEVLPGFEGQGIGSRLVRAVFEDLRERGIPLIPKCPFIVRWLERHPEQHDVSHARLTHFFGEVAQVGEQGGRGSIHEPANAAVLGTHTRRRQFRGPGRAGRDDAGHVWR